MTNPPDLQLSRLTYYSTAEPGLDLSVLASILEASEVGNTRDGITGALVFADGRFAQILEGEREAISKTYSRILLDKRHHTVCLVEFAECDSRIFVDWSMKHLKIQRTFIEKSIGGDVFAPQAFNAAELLAMFVRLHEAG